MNQVLGRFQLVSDESGPSLTGASIQLNGTRTGMSNLNLWASSDVSFDAGSDTRLGSTVPSDPGDGNTVSFNSFSNSIGTTTTTYFLTADIASDATGVVQGVVAQNSSLSVSGVAISTSISNAPLSNGDASLPVELFLFSGEAVEDGILLNWTTESEVNHAGFILERLAVGADPGGPDVWLILANHHTHPALAGRGNTSSRTDYAYTDVTTRPGFTYRYRLSDVDTNGELSILDVFEISWRNQIPDETRLNPASPNPFNPQTKISYQLAEASTVLLSVYDIQGRQVSGLIQGTRHSPGSYSVFWNGKDSFGRQAASGTYILHLIAGEVVLSRKVLLMR